MSDEVDIDNLSQDELKAHYEQIDEEMRELFGRSADLKSRAWSLKNEHEQLERIIETKGAWLGNRYRKARPIEERQEAVEKAEKRLPEIEDLHARVVARLREISEAYKEKQLRAILAQMRIKKPERPRCTLDDDLC